MTKTINPDVAAFKDDFFKGLSFRECIFGGSALLVGVGGILLLHFILKWESIQPFQSVCRSLE